MQCRHCHFAQTGISAGFCCRLCVRTPGKHGPFCEQRLVKCQANCGFAVTRHGATHCCLRCEHGEPHGPRCKRIAYVEPAPDSDRFVGPRCIPSEFQLGDRVRSGGSWSGDAAATGEHADADSLEPEPYQKPELEPEPELEDDPPDPELERTLQANALRIEQQEALIGRMLERVELLEAQRQAQRQAEQPPGTGVG